MTEIEAQAEFETFLEKIKQMFPDIEFTGTLTSLAKIFYNQGIIDCQTKQLDALKEELVATYVEKRCDWCDALLGNTYFTGQTDKLFCSTVCLMASTHPSQDLCPDGTSDEDSDWPELFG
jgi:uncharacterized protein (DUF2164 family)